MPFERYEILLPLKYNDGTPVEPEKFQATRRKLVGQFGAMRRGRECGSCPGGSANPSPWR